MRFIKNNRAIVFELLIAAAMGVVIFFALMNVGTFIAGSLNDTFISSYPSNTQTGSIDSTYWHNATSNESRNVTLTSPNNVGQLNGATSKFYILANGSFPIIYNLTVNNVAIARNATITASNGVNWTVTALIAAGALARGDSYINYSWDVNSSESQIYIRTYGTYYKNSDWRTGLENNTYNQLSNISGGYDNNIDIMIIAIIITVITIPLAAVIAIKKII